MLIEPLMRMQLTEPNVVEGRAVSVSMKPRYQQYELYSEVEKCRLIDILNNE